MYSERERERESCIKSLRIFILRCNHFINFNIFYFLLHERAKALPPPCKHLKRFCVKKSAKFSQNLNKKVIKFFTKNISLSLSLSLSLCVYMQLYMYGGLESSNAAYPGLHTHTNTHIRTQTDRHTHTH